MYLFCIFVLLIGNTGNVECNYKNENRFEFVFGKSEICSRFEEDSVCGYSIGETSLEVYSLGSVALISGLGFYLLPFYAAWFLFIYKATHAWKDDGHFWNLLPKYDNLHYTCVSLLYDCPYRERMTALCCIRVLSGLL